MDTNHLLIERKNTYAILTFNRPEKRNALTIALRDKFRKFIKDEANQYHAVIVTGAGAMFSAGMDLTEKMGEGEGEEQLSLMQAIYECPTPFIAAINGPVYGAGLTIIASCDLAIASSDTTFALPQIRHNFYTGIAGPIVQLMLPKKVAAYLILTGLKMPAEKAEQLGFINQIVEKDKVLETAEKLTQHLSGFNREVLKLCKTGLNTVPFTAEERKLAIEKTYETYQKNKDYFKRNMPNSKS